MKILPLGAE